MSKIGEIVLGAFCRDVNQEDYPGGTSRTTLDNSLDFLLKTVPDFLVLVNGKCVLDFGCGFGNQAVALARSKARHVVGLDLDRPVLQSRWREFERTLALPNLTLTTAIPEGEQFDVVYSCSSFEHFSDPVDILRRMRELTRPGGKVVITFAEPWLSNHGSHMDGITRLPWVNVWFSEATVMAIRSRYRTDKVSRYEDVEGGMNRMTVAKFERIMRGSGMHIDSLRLFATKGLPLVTKIPIVREFWTSAASCVLTKTPAGA